LSSAAGTDRLTRPGARPSIISFMKRLAACALAAGLLAAAARAEPDPDDLIIAARLARHDGATKERLRTLAIEPAKSFESTFPVSPMAGGDVDEAGVAGGLRALYAAEGAELTDDALAREGARAKDFGERVRALIETARAAGGWKYRLDGGKTEWLGAVVRYELSFPSAFSRGGQPSDEFRAYLYLPRDAGACGRVYPAGVIVHHIEDDVSAEQSVAKVLALEEDLPGPGGLATLVIFLPHYGPRRSGPDDRFMTADAAAYEDNLVQAVADLHMARDFMASLPEVDKSRISLEGVSLGAMVGMVAAGVDPAYAGYGFLVGGGDMPAILRGVNENRPTYAVAQEYRALGLGDAAARDGLAPLDAIVWAHRLRGSRVFMLNAAEDKIIPVRSCVDPLVAAYKAGGTRVDLRLHAGDHNVRLGLKAWGELFKPLYEFAAVGGPRLGACPPPSSP